MNSAAMFKTSDISALYHRPLSYKGTAIRAANARPSEALAKINAIIVARAEGRISVIIGILLTKANSNEM